MTSRTARGLVMRRLTDELVFGKDVRVDKTYETIRVLKHGQIEERRTLTRLENFVDHHEEWRELCHVYLKECISTICGTDMVLFKEKLNLKPPGGSGFAPHVDTPSLRVALGEAGPQTFVTVCSSVRRQPRCRRARGGHSSRYCGRVRFWRFNMPRGRYCCIQWVGSSPFLSECISISETSCVSYV